MYFVTTAWLLIKRYFVFMQQFWFPEDVGFPWYDEQSNNPTYVRLETHYDNRAQVEGLRFLKFLFTGH